MKKILIGAIVVILLIFGLSKLNNTSAVDENGKQTIKIGATLPLTGDGAEAGQAAKASMAMALEKIQ